MKQLNVALKSLSEPSIFGFHNVDWKKNPHNNCRQPTPTFSEEKYKWGLKEEPT